jgi:hypothetical protein
MSRELTAAVKTYDWQCMDCKQCSQCSDPKHEDLLLVCDDCDRGYHTFCVGLEELPSGRCAKALQPLTYWHTLGARLTPHCCLFHQDRWICKNCGECDSCGRRTPGRRGTSWVHKVSASATCGVKARRQKITFLLQNEDTDYEPITLTHHLCLYT